MLLVPLVVRDVPGEPYQDAVSPYGYSGPVSNVTPEDENFWARAVSSMAQTLAGQRIIAAFVRIHPLLPVSYDAMAGVGTVVQHGETVSVKLDLPPEGLWRATRHSHRRAIEKARKDGMQVSIDEWDYLDDFIETYQQTMARLRATENYCFDAEYFGRLRRHLGDHVHLAVALLDGEFVGGLLFFHYRRLAHAHLSCTGDNPKARGASKLLDDEVRRWAQGRSATDYHLGGGVGGRNDSLFDYKKGFSPHSHPFCTWRVVTDGVAYEAVSQRSSTHRASSAPDFFPAYRSP